MTKSTYVFGAAMALGTVSGLAEHADAATLATFTFETSATALNTLNVTGPVFGPFIAESGVGTGSASHAAATTVFSSPAGNGSARSLSANNYAAGDYFQFSVPTTGITGIMVGFDAVSSSTGPKVFNLAYSTNGTSYSNFTSYTVNTGTATSFGTVANTAVSFSFDLSSITALNNNPLAAFRLIEADTTTATGGTSRVDNVVVASTPEPAMMSLSIAVIGGLAARRRRA